MKAKITVAGETMELEGTPEEIAQFRRYLNSNAPNREEEKIESNKLTDSISKLNFDNFEGDGYPSVDEFLTMIRERPEIYDKDIKFGIIMKALGKPLSKSDGSIRYTVYSRFRTAKNKYEREYRNREPSHS